MKNKIEKALGQLVGLGFTRTTRTGATECIKFGVLYRVVDRKGIECQIGEFSIHLQCPWRITKGNSLIVGSDDVVEQPNETAEYDENFDWDVKMGNLRDVKMANFIKSGKYIVESVKSDDIGGFELAFNDDIKLTVFPTSSSQNFYSEHWRLLDNRDEDKNHFVVNALGIDE